MLVLSDFDDGNHLVESVSGKWHRCTSSLHTATMVLEMPNDVLLGIHVHTGRIDVLTKNTDGIFEYTADFSVLNDEKGVRMHVFSPAIDHVHFHDEAHVVTNDLSRLKSVFIALDLAKKQIPSLDQ